MARVLVLGATGYVGGRLVPRLLEDSHRITCLVRDSRRLEGKPWYHQVIITQGDVLDKSTLMAPFAEADIIYYLVHSMRAGKGSFEELDREAAKNVAEAAEAGAVKQIVYLGGLGKVSDSQSAHLRSRNEVGAILKTGATPVTVFRAAVIVGAGSLSFELIHHLINRLPIMICPRWIYSRTQPIGIDDVISYLRAAVDRTEAYNQTIDIGGPEIMSYGDMTMTIARVLKLKRRLIPVPVLTPRLSSYWVNLVTPIPSSVAGPLIEGLRFDTICDNSLAEKIFDIRPAHFEDSVRRALRAVSSGNIETNWTSAAGKQDAIEIDSSHIKRDCRRQMVDADAESVFVVIRSIGGKNGWYYGNWLWKLRGFIDKQMGGVGLRRGRRHPSTITAGEALDFWRVEEYQNNRRMRLKAEMKVGGHAWLDFEVKPLDRHQSELIQTAEYYPRGLIGLLYWYGVYPIHAMVFRGLSRAIARRALELSRNRTNRDLNLRGE